MPRPSVRRLTGPVALAATLLVAACGGGAEPGGTGGRVAVVASTDVYGAIVSAVGGDRVAVTSIINNPSKDPAAYDSTPSDAVAISRARLVIGNGGGYDDFVFRLAKTAGGDRTVLNVSEQSGLPGKVPAGEEFNEHVWFDLGAMQVLGEQVAKDLSAVDPAGADAYRAGAGRFSAAVQTLRAKVADLSTQFSGARVTSTEPLPLYLIQQAGLVNATPKAFMKASEQGTDAPAAVVQQTLALVAGPDPVRALLLNTQTQTPATDRLRAAATSAGVPEVPVFETIGDPAKDYVSWMGAQIEDLGKALRRSA
ncbi:MAG: zinc ABC transporter substrate-binding protein [Frankiales bacterium]|nr:zinc ABC transporter substrate-binding protein [Frankiales bacterium]